MKLYLTEIISEAAKKVSGDVELPPVTIEKPRIPEHGDAATNIALQLANPLKKSPRIIAEDIVEALIYDPAKIKEVQIAGPGFINFRFADEGLHEVLVKVEKEGEEFGKSNLNAGQRIQVEFVSANPTGPLTVGHGRNAVLGDTIARLLEWTGAQVDREYYFNNAGRQMRVLGESVKYRYLELLGEDMEFPEGGYEGEYIRDVAIKLHEANGEKLRDVSPESIFKEAAESAIFKEIKNTLKRMNIEMDAFFNENKLYDSGAIDKVLDHLGEEGLIYEKDGATWFKTTSFGKDQDTVLKKSTGEPTYRLPDIAYHANKLERGYDLCVDVFGADHIATYPDVLSALKAMGYDPNKVDVLVYQFVTIIKDGKPFKMSTRKANYVTLDELMDEVGADVTRFFFLMRSPNTHLEFDIGQAKEAGEKNPVFYLQYAHARIKSIFRKASEEYDLKGSTDYTKLDHPSETRLIKRISEFPDAIESAAVTKEPHRLINYLNELAVDFHKFYHDCHILGEEQGLAKARIALLLIVARVLANGLGILGISAPDRM
ncbi:MAG: arginine--tRNA ligase [Balneolales bacterium]